MLHHAWHLAQLSRQPLRIPNLAESAIQNVIILVGHIRFSLDVGSQLHLGAHCRNPFRDQPLRKLDDLEVEETFPTSAPVSKCQPRLPSAWSQRPQFSPGAA